MPRPIDHGRCQRSGRATRWRCLLLCWLALAFIWPGLARAIDGDDLLVRTGVGLQYETNLFRLPSNPVSDMITFESAGLSFVRPTSAQVFRASFDVRNNHYREYSYLDGIGYNAALGWRLLHGDADTLDVDVSYNRTLLGFADVRTAGRPSVNVAAASVRGSLQFAPRWSAIAGVGTTTTDNQPASRSFLDYQLNFLETGLRFDWRTGSVFDFVWRNQTATFTQPNSSADGTDGYNENLVGVRMNWQVSEATSVFGRFGLQSRDYTAGDNPNFTGLSYVMSMRWQPRASLTIDATARNELSAAAEINANYARLRGLNVGAAWQATGKTVVRVGAEVLNRNFTGTPGTVAAGPERQDKIYGATIGVAYRPMRTVELGVDYRLDRRDSNNASYDYNAQVVVLRVFLEF
jgi:hypothetical protein